MTITFLGTRGYIDAQSRAHKRHTSTLITHRGKHIMIDCGLDWQRLVWRINPDAIVLTHAHPDHVDGLKYGSPCPVYATRDTWHSINDYLIATDKRIIIKRNHPFALYGITFIAVSATHSLRAPAVSYRISDGKKTVFYAGDIVYLPHRARALHNVSLYIGDASTISTSLVRKKNGHIYGHASVSTQLAWCKKSHVPNAIFTHCGSEIVEHDGRSMAALIRRLGNQRSVHAHLAHDNLQLTLL